MHFISTREGILDLIRMSSFFSMTHKVLQVKCTVRILKHFYIWSNSKYWLRYGQTQVGYLVSGPIFGTIPGFLLNSQQNINRPGIQLVFGWHTSGIHKIPGKYQIWKYPAHFWSFLGIQLGFNGHFRNHRQIPKFLDDSVVLLSLWL